MIALLLLLASHACIQAAASGLAGLFLLGGPLAAAGFSVFSWAAAEGHPELEATEQLEHELPQPPFLVPGLVAVTALIEAVVGHGLTSPPILVLSLLLGTALCAREGLSFQWRRLAREELSSSVELENRLLAVQAEEEPTVDPTAALRRSCDVAVEVLRANAALAWLSDGDGLVLRSIWLVRRSRVVHEASI